MPERKPASQNQTAQLLKRLTRVQQQFDKAALREKLAIIRHLSRARINRPSEILLYHDLLCFLRAYSDSQEVVAITERELRSFEKRVEWYKENSRDRHGEKLANSGIVGSVTTYPWSYELTSLLSAWHPAAVELNWEQNEAALDELYNVISYLAAWCETDSLDYDEELVMNDWLNLARGRKTGGQLKQLLTLFAGSELSAPIQKHFYDSLEVEPSWDLSKSPASRTLKRMLSEKKFYQTEPIKPRTRDMRAELKKPASPLINLSRKEGEKWVRAANEMLAVRNRELLPVTTANPSEVYLTQPGRGLTIAVMGMKPEVRLPLESNYGAILIRNGMPVGYGVAATLFDRVEIAINVFPAFRGGESSFFIEQFFRLFYHHFGSRVFLVRNTQMGYGEEEALHSGAFWFYYKLGFRAFDPTVRALAEREIKKIRERKGYRVPLATMKRLSKSDVYLHTDPSQMDSWRELSIINLGYHVTDYFARQFDGDRKLGTAQTAKRIARKLKLDDLDSWTPDERTALDRLAPLVACIESLGRWTDSEKQGLGKVIRAKGSARERRFNLLSTKHHRFRQAIEQLAGERV